jgi:hypothetical protein
MLTKQLSLVAILVITVIYPNQGTQNIANAQIDQSETVYTPFDKVVIKIFSPDSNQDRDQIDTIRVLVSSSFSQKQLSLPETGLSSGVFEDDIRLSPDLSKFPGDIQTRREDGLSISFRIDEDTVVTQSIFVNYHIGTAFFDKASYKFGDQATITIADRDMNRNPDTIDTLDARIWSDSDRGGLFVTLRETGAATGVFEEIMTFTLDEESSGTRLRVSEGDRIVLKYTDNTLPPPAALSAGGIETVEVREIFAESIFGQEVPSMDRAPASEPIIVDSFGKGVSQVFVGEQILVQSEVTNTQNKKQPFVYILQVKDSEGITESLSWISAQLPANESLKVAQSWIPSGPGEYTVEIFVWDSLTNLGPLSPVRTKTVNILS